MSKKNTRNTWRRKAHYRPTNNDHFYMRVYGAYKRFIWRVHGQLSNYYPYEQFIEQIRLFGVESTYFNIGYDMLIAEIKGETKQHVKAWKRILNI